MWPRPRSADDCDEVTQLLRQGKHAAGAGQGRRACIADQSARRADALPARRDPRPKATSRRRRTRSAAHPGLSRTARAVQQPGRASTPRKASSTGPRRARTSPSTRTRATRLRTKICGDVYAALPQMAYAARQSSTAARASLASSRRSARSRRGRSRRSRLAALAASQAGPTAVWRACHALCTSTPINGAS